MVTPRQALWLELMPFYIHEAWLLDERKFKEWLDLFTDDVLYFMPRRKNVLRRESHREVTPLGDLALIEDDRRYLEMRVARLDTGMAWGEDPPSRTRHLIGNLVAEPLDSGEVKAKTAFLVYRSHLETDHQLLAGSREDVLRRGNGVWKIAKRTVLLDANVLLDKNRSFFPSGNVSEVPTPCSLALDRERVGVRVDPSSNSSLAPPFTLPSPLRGEGNVLP